MPNPYKKGTKNYEKAEAAMKKRKALKKKKRKGGKLMGGKSQRKQLEALENY
jgi:hypothetical protein